MHIYITRYIYLEYVTNICSPNITFKKNTKEKWAKDLNRHLIEKIIKWPKIMSKGAQFNSFKKMKIINHNMTSIYVPKANWKG